MAWATRKHMTTEHIICRYMKKDTCHMVHSITVTRAVIKWKFNENESIIFQRLIL